MPIAPLLKPVVPLERCFVRQRHENVRLEESFGPLEAFRGNSNDGVRMLVNANRFSHDVGIRAEIALPCWPGKHGGFGSSGMVVVGAPQQPPEERLDGDSLEVLSADIASPDWPSDAVSFEVKIRQDKSGNRGEHRVVIADID